MVSSAHFRFNAAAERYAATVAEDTAMKERHLRSAEEWERLARKVVEQSYGRPTSKRLADGTYFSERTREKP